MRTPQIFRAQNAIDINSKGVDPFLLLSGRFSCASIVHAGFDIPQFSSLFCCVRLFRQIVALILLAVWIPATQHCVLEVADLLSLHAQHSGNVECCDADSASTADCEMGELIAYRSSNDALVISAPDFVACVYHLSICLFDRSLRTDLGVPIVADKAIDWVPDWHFARRAARLARAPSMHV
jgi:hypothetical protein